jgi:hypothetical protein
MTNEDTTADVPISDWTLATGTKPGARDVYSPHTKSTARHAQPEAQSSQALRDARPVAAQLRRRTRCGMQRFRTPLHNGRTAAATRHSHRGSIYGVGGRFQPFRINNLELVAQIFPRWNPLKGGLLNGNPPLVQPEFSS